MHAAKHFQHLRFPWKFADRNPFVLKPLPDVLERDLEPFLEGFRFGILQTLEAIVAKDTRFLRSIMEPTLFKEFKEGMEVLERRRHNMDLINPDSSFSTFVYNEKIYSGLHIDRAKNAGKTLHTLPEYNSDRTNVPLDNIQVHFGKENHIVLKVDVLCSSGKKLVVLDENGKVCIGKNNKNIERHKFRFECFHQGQAKVFGNFGSLCEIVRYFVFSTGKAPMEFNNWFITDIDDFLEGNPIVKSNLFSY